MGGVNVARSVSPGIMSGLGGDGWSLSGLGVDGRSLSGPCSIPLGGVGW